MTKFFYLQHKRLNNKNHLKLNTLLNKSLHAYEIKTEAENNCTGKQYIMT